MKLRISLVNYLNAAPLGWYFLHGPIRHRFRVFPATPAQCAEQLARGEVDVGLIPSIEYQRTPGLCVIPDIAVAAINEVRSVLLVRPTGGANRSPRSVALDTSSRTSVALLKLLLKIRMGLEPEYRPHEPDVTGMLATCDAALVIGDTALHCSPEQYDIMDLGAAWRSWQQRPFVFAFWACRPEAMATTDLVPLFQEARDWGLARIDEIAAAYAVALTLPQPFLKNYLCRNLDHSMGAEHIEGLERFYRLSHQAGLIKDLMPVRFASRAPSVETGGESITDGNSGNLQGPGKNKS